MTQRYFPDSQPEQALWYQNFKNEFPGVAISLGFVAGEITAITGDCSMAVWLLSQVSPHYEAFSKGVTGYVATILHGEVGTPLPPAPVPPAWPTPPAGSLAVGIDERRQAWVERLKASPAYDPATIGGQLGTEPTGSPFDPATYVANIVSAIGTGPQEVTIKFRKAGGAIDGVNLYCRRKGQTTWSFVKFYSRTPGVDRSPVAVPGTPEERDYKARAVIADVEVGIESEITSVVVRA